MTLPNPWIILASITVALTAYFYGHHAGYVEKETEVQLEIAHKNEEARTKEQELHAEIDDINNTLAKANNALEQESAALDRAIRAGRVRFPTSCVQTGTSPTSTSSGGDAPTSESDRETLAAIAAIVAQGDRNTEQLNACIAAYNQVRETVNGQR